MTAREKKAETGGAADTVIVVPSELELRPLLEAIEARGLRSHPNPVGRMRTTRVPDLGLCLAIGGHGKTQFALQTQHLIDRGPRWAGVVCAGAAGSLDDACAVGDVVVGTETIEHDMRFSSGKPHPRFPASPGLLARFSRAGASVSSATVHFAPIASGDEDVTDIARRASIRSTTGALAVAWEGAGGARSSRFSDVPYIEIRGITDLADEDLAGSFAPNVPRAMAGVSSLLLSAFGAPAASGRPAARRQPGPRRFPASRPRRSGQG